MLCRGSAERNRTLPFSINLVSELVALKEMDHQNTPSNLQSNLEPGSRIPWLRLLGGAVLGFLISFILYILNEIVGLPLFGLVVHGQLEVFEFLFFNALYDGLRSTTLTDGVALIVYSSVWAFIGALLMSGIRKQRKIGVILLILYVIGGVFFYLVLMMTRIPT